MNTMNFEIPKLGKKAAETDQQIKERLRERFEILNDMTRAV